MSGSAGSGGCAGADLQADEDHCGKCQIKCDTGATCESGVCATLPCDGMGCTTVVSVNEMVPSSGDYQVDNIPLDPPCYEVVGYTPVAPDVPRFISWNLDSAGGSLAVNGVKVLSKLDPGCQLTNGPKPRAGGYCVKPTPMSNNSAGFKFPANRAAGGSPCVGP